MNLTRYHNVALTIILFLAQLGLFLWITLRPFSISPPGRTYYILRGQGAYTAFIRQAKEGAWALYNPYTTRPTPTLYTQLLYVFLGKIATIFSLDPVFTYMIARIVAGFILFVATYWFVSAIVPKHAQFVALLFALGIEPAPLITSIKNISTITGAPPAIFSYFPQEVALRHFGLPHHVLAEALGLLLLGNIFLYVKKQSWQHLIIIGLLTIVGTFLMPAYNCVIVLTVLVAWTVWAVIRHDIKRIIPPFAIIIISVAVVGLFTKIQMDSGHPWKDFNLDEKRWVTDSELLKNYLSSLLLYLPAFVALLATLPRVWRQLDRQVKLVVIVLIAWVIGPLLYIPLTHLSFFPFANFRLVDGYAYVPMGILSALGLYWLAGTVKKRWIIKTGAIIMVLVSLLFTVSYTKQAFADQQRVWSNVYPFNNEWMAMRYLSTVPRKSGVLVMQHFGEIIPSYATVRVFLGETPGQIDWQDRHNEAVTFFSGTFSDIDAKTMLQRENISYVWWGAEEKELLTTGSLYPDVLSPIFETPEITIFKVK